MGTETENKYINRLKALGNEIIAYGSDFIITGTVKGNEVIENRNYITINGVQEAQRDNYRYLYNIMDNVILQHKHNFSPNWAFNALKIYDVISRHEIISDVLFYFEIDNGRFRFMGTTNDDEQVDVIIKYKNGNINIDEAVKMNYANVIAFNKIFKLSASSGEKLIDYGINIEYNVFTHILDIGFDSKFGWRHVDFRISNDGISN